MGVADSSTVFTARGRQYRLDESESAMVHYINLAEIRIRTMKKNGKVIERLLHGKRWTTEEFLVLLPGGFTGRSIADLVQRVKSEMDAGWRPLD